MRNRWPYPYMEEGGLCYSKSINESAKERILDYLKDSLEFLDKNYTNYLLHVADAGSYKE